MQSSGISSPETQSAIRSPAELTRKRFSLSGLSPHVDSRIDAVRGDLADVRLADRIFAPHYAAAILCSATQATPILAAKPNGDVISEILPGEGFEMLELATEYAWGVCQGDGTVGFVARGALSYDDPAAPAPPSDSDYVTLAEMLVGCPAKPGGRSPAGFNCTGLVFYVLTRTGWSCPRFVDLQEADLGAPVMGHPAYVRGELVFFADHVAIMVDAENAVHVTDSVVREPLSAIEAAFGDVVGRRRL